MDKPPTKLTAEGYSGIELKWNKDWESKAEAEALDGIITLVFQYLGDTREGIETHGVRSVERVIDLLEEYGLVREYKDPIPDIPLQYFRVKRVDQDRWGQLTDFIQSND